MLSVPSAAAVRYSRRGASARCREAIDATVVSSLCPAAPLVQPQTLCWCGFEAKAHTGFEPAPPGRDTTRHPATPSDRNPPYAAGFVVLRATNRDSTRQGATGLWGQNCPNCVHEGRRV